MPSQNPIDFDHISFAVQELMPVAQELRKSFGVTPIFGEALPEFRYILLHTGDTRSYTRIELMEAAGEGFLQKYLEKFGPGAHHVTFAVPDVLEVARKVEAAGFKVVGEDVDNPSWMEAFIAPDGVHRFVIQIASSERSYPTPEEILTSQERNLASMPAVEDGLDPSWWEALWAVESGPALLPGAVIIRSTDLEKSRTLFQTVLGGELISESAESLEFGWQGGKILLQYSETPGAVGLNVPSLHQEFVFGSAKIGEL